MALELRVWAKSLEEAEKLHRGVLKLRKAVLGKDLDVWVSSVSLGIVLQV